jgi:hypothetical protein
MIHRKYLLKKAIMKACKIQAGVWLRADHLIGISEKLLTA